MRATTLASERLGAGLSLACAVHCFLVPLIAAILPLSGLQLAVAESLEWIMYPSLALVIAGTVVRSRGAARRTAVLAIVFGAALLLAGSRFVHGIAAPLMSTTGALTLAATQLRMCRWSSDHCACHEEGGNAHL